MYMLAKKEKLLPAVVCIVHLHLMEAEMDLVGIVQTRPELEVERQILGLVVIHLMIE